MSEHTERWVKCPQCNQPSLYASSNRHRPFCSERCRQIDLGAWASESHRMPDESPADDIEGLDRPS